MSISENSYFWSSFQYKIFKQKNLSNSSLIDNCSLSSRQTWFTYIHSICCQAISKLSVATRKHESATNDKVFTFFATAAFLEKLLHILTQSLVLLLPFFSMYQGTFLYDQKLSVLSCKVFVVQMQPIIKQ
jgi:hypothetical protein